MSDHTLIALSREVAALTQARDRLQQDLDQANTIAGNGLDEIRRLVAEVNRLQQEGNSCAELWTQAEQQVAALKIQVQALEAAASHLPNLRELLGRYLDGATMLRQRPSRLILQDLFALIHEYDKAALPAPPAAARREEEP